MAHTPAEETELAHLLEQDGADDVAKASRPPAFTIPSQRRSYHVRHFVFAVFVATTAFLSGRWSVSFPLLAAPSVASSQGLEDVQILSDTEQAILDARFGQRNRTCLSQARSLPSFTKGEVDHIWPNSNLSSGTCFMLSYLAERHREAVLWSFFVGLGDKDGSNDYSYEERQSILHRLSGRVDHGVLQLDTCKVSLLDCFGTKDFFTQDSGDSSLLNPQELVKWIAFANPRCANCILKQIKVDQLLGTYAASQDLKNAEVANCVLGGDDQYWKEVDYTWPDCEGDVVLSRETVIHSLLNRYSP